MVEHCVGGGVCSQFHHLYWSDHAICDECELPTDEEVIGLGNQSTGHGVRINRFQTTNPLSIQILGAMIFAPSFVLVALNGFGGMCYAYLFRFLILLFR